MSSEMMSIGVGHVVFPAEEVAKLSMTPRAQREGAACGQIHGSDGPVAPSVGSWCSWAITDIDLHILHEMRILLWRKRTTYPVATLALTLLLSNKTLLTHGHMS